MSATIISRGSHGVSGSTISKPCRIRRDGTPVEISVSLSPIRGPAGEIIGASGAARVLTDARQTERALQQQIEERRQLFDASEDLIMIMNSRGHIVQISPSCETVLGYKPDEMIGRSGVDFIHPAHLDQSREEMRALRRGGHPKLADTRCIHKDGHEVWLSWLGNWSDQAKRFFFVGRDMTEARHAAESLRDSEQLARNIVETALDAFVQTDDRSTILNWSSRAEELFGWRRDEALGQNAVDLIVAESERERVKAGLARFLEFGRWPDAQPPPRAHGPTPRRQGVQGRAERHGAAAPRGRPVQRVLPRPHRQDRLRGTHPPRREDGGGRPAHRRRGARFQQHPHRDHRDDRDPRGGRGQGSRRLPRSPR